MHIPQRPIVRRFLRRSRRVTRYALIFTLLAAALGAYGSYAIASYFDTHRWEFRSPVQTPVVVTVRTEAAALAETIPLWQQLNLTGIEKQICQRFGTDCKMAMAISKAENGSRTCELIHKNKNGSVDVGLFQINTVHFDKYSQRQLTDCSTNLDAAYELYLEQGWNPWVAYLNGSYKKFLK